MSDLVDRFEEVDLLVVGDVLLDGWLSGPASALSREAPVPVVTVRGSVESPGGAGNTAVGAAALGARVRLLATTGDDADGDRLRRLLRAAGVDTAGVLVEPGRRTVAKRRISSGEHLHLRYDSGDTGPPSTAVAGALAERVEAAAGTSTAVLVCDYGSGLLTDSGRWHLARAVRAAGRPLVVDSHDPAGWAAVHPDAITPNAAEVATLLPAGATAAFAADRVGTVLRYAAAILAASGAGMVVATLDADGAVLLRPDADPVHVPAAAAPAPPERTAGAGDTFAAAFTLGLAAGATPEWAVQVGCAAAAVVVRQPGTSVCTAADLSLALGGREHTDRRLADDIAGQRAAGRRIVFTNGCFDVLHSGHVAYLAAAKALGDVLVVGVNSDDSVRRLKGPDRPINPLADRLAVLGALTCVDHLVVFDGDTAAELIAELRPEVYAKGGDYTEAMLAEAPLVRSYGGVVRLVDYVENRSTAGLVRRIRDGAR